MIRQKISLASIYLAGFISIACLQIFVSIHYSGLTHIREYYSGLIMLTTSFLATVGMLYATIKSVRERWFIRTGWIILTIAFAFDFVGTFLDVIITPDNPAILNQVFYLASYSLISIGILFIPSSPRPTKRRPRKYLDIIIFVLLSQLAVWGILIFPSINTPSNSFHKAFVADNYLMVFAVLDLLLRRKQYSFQKVGFLFSIGVGTIILGHILLMLQSYGFLAWENSVMYLSWIVSDGAFGIAAISLEFRNQAAFAEKAFEKSTYHGRRRTFLLPSIWVGLTYFLLIWSHFNSEIVSFPVLAIGTGGLISVLIYHLTNAYKENYLLIEAANEEIRSRNSIQEKLLHDTRHDSLTTLPNRTYLMDQLRNALDTARETRTIGSSLFFLDLDNFKKFNDEFGHLSGDELLKAFAERLIFCVRPDDFVARLGGDEFAIMLNNLQTSKTVNKVAARIMEKMKEPFEIDGTMYVSGVSFGITYILPTCNSPEDILREADKALYIAKRKGRNRFEVSGNVEF